MKGGGRLLILRLSMTPTDVHTRVLYILKGTCVYPLPIMQPESATLGQKGPKQKERVREREEEREVHALYAAGYSVQSVKLQQTVTSRKRKKGHTCEVRFS